MPALNGAGEGTTHCPDHARQSDWTRGAVWGILTLFCISLSFQKINRTPSDEECFFDLLSKFQSNRMDDQRCPLEECPSEAAEAAATPVPALEERICKYRCVRLSLLLPWPGWLLCFYYESCDVFPKPGLPKLSGSLAICVIT